MTPVTRYCLLQIPGILFLCGVLWWGVSLRWMTLDTAGWILVAWVLKDAMLYPLYRPALQRGPGHGTQALEGRLGKVVRPLTPRGQVRVDGELWAAVDTENRPLRRGDRVRVVGARGLTLLVEPETVSP